MTIQQMLLSGGSFKVTGGVVTTVGSKKLHTFSSSNEFIVTGNKSVELFMVGGGGAGSGNNWYTNGGGGAGEDKQENLVLTDGTYYIEIGAGGVGVPAGSGNNGGDTILYKNGVEILRARGGKGGIMNGGDCGNPTYTGGVFTTTNVYRGGGGGAGGRGNGGNGGSTSAGNGGPGFVSDFNGVATNYCGGGAGSGDPGGVGQNGGGNSVKTGNGGYATTIGSGGGAGRDTSNRRGGDGYRGVLMFKYTE